MEAKFLNYIFVKSDKHFRLGNFSKSGRNFTGKICVHHRGGGAKRNFRHIDFFRRMNMTGIIFKICYDTFRNAFTGLVLYKNGLLSNIILTDSVNVGDIVYSGINTVKTTNYIPGTSMALYHINLYSIINNLEFFPYNGASLLRAAGVGGLIVGRVGDLMSIKLKSGWIIYVLDKCFATLGHVSNILHKFKIIRKAGYNVNKGIRPTVRGVAMNPCDHPHGGGEGKKSHPRAPRTPWGKLAKGTHTKKKQIDVLNRRLFKNIR